MTNQYSRPASSTNGLGIAGFIVSIVGLLITGGVACPIGLILSLIALRKPPRGFAIAGTIIGFLGTLIPVLILVVYGVAALSFCACLAAANKYTIIENNTATAIRAADLQIVDYYNTNHELPDDPTGNARITALRDGWDHPLQYTRRPDGLFEIRSAGPDGVMNNLDDRVQIFTPTGATLPADTMPATLPEH